MKKILQLNSAKELLILLISWRLLLFLITIIATLLYAKTTYPFPYTDSILIPTGLPKWIWGFANFDGVHYIRTALWGYVSEYSQAFFPLYPLLLYIMSFWNSGIEQKTVLLINGLFISTTSFVAGFYLFKKLLLEEKKSDKIIKYSLLLLLFFPTSFYFVSVYTEGLFFLFSIGSIYLIHKKKYLYAGIVIALATATRLIGIFLMIIYVIEMIKELHRNKKDEHYTDLFTKLFGLAISSFGVIAYMFFLYYQYNNPFYFLTAQPLFGAERQVDTIVLLPQVFYRYLKMLVTVPVMSSQFFTAVNELLFSLFGLLLLFVSFRKVKHSIWLFSLAVYLLPTFTGTLSSMPRYVLMLFMLFPAYAEVTLRYKKIILTLFLGIQLLFTSLFVLGFWIA